MMPAQVLQELEERGLRVRLVGDRLRVAPAPVPRDVDELIKANRDALVAVLRGKCPRCGERLKTVIRAERYAYIECASDPVDYAELVNRTGGQSMGIFTNYESGGKCMRCGTAAETFNGACESCHANAESAQASATGGQ